MSLGGDFWVEGGGSLGGGGGGGGGELGREGVSWAGRGVEFQVKSLG